MCWKTSDWEKREKVVLFSPLASTSRKLLTVEIQMFCSFSLFSLHSALSLRTSPAVLFPFSSSPSLLPFFLSPCLFFSPTLVLTNQPKAIEVKTLMGVLGRIRDVLQPSLSSFPLFFSRGMREEGEEDTEWIHPQAMAGAHSFSLWLFFLFFAQRRPMPFPPRLD